MSIDALENEPTTRMLAELIYHRMLYETYRFTKFSLAENYKLTELKAKAVVRYIRRKIAPAQQVMIGYDYDLELYRVFRPDEFDIAIANGVREVLSIESYLKTVNASIFFPALKNGKIDAGRYKKITDALTFIGKALAEFRKDADPSS